jgi:SAM-dependent methyltransferase
VTLHPNEFVNRSVDSQDPDFWEERYRAERVPWDLGGEPTDLARALGNELPRPGKVLIPGCGSGYEVRSFAAAGWDVCAIDFAPAAVARARRMLGPLGDRVRVADFFGDSLAGPFDVVYERTFLCSLPPTLWADYAERVAALLRPGGVLAGIFFYGVDPEPPPHPLTPAEADRLFGRQFRRIVDRPIAADDSLPIYGGAERWQLWERLPTPTP